MVPSYDLNWRQMRAMILQTNQQPWGRGVFEVVIHQHMPMFHMEHCVFAHTLSDGRDYRTCGRPCDRHRVALRDRMGVDHPLVADVGCRNTVFNGQAQSGADYVDEMIKLGVVDFRVELLRENPAEAVALLGRYARLVTGQDKPTATMRALRAVRQLGVVPGTLERE